MSTPLASIMPPAQQMPGANLLQYQTSHGTENQQFGANRGTTQNTQQMNVYNPQQSAMQQSLGGTIGSMLNGTFDYSRVGLPQNVWDTAIYEFNKNEAPLLAAQHGAGSPAIGGNMEDLILQLASMGSQQAHGNAQGILNSGLDYAFRQIGSNENMQQAQNEQGWRNTQTTDSQWNTDVGGLLGWGMQFAYPWLPGGPFS